MAQINEWEKEYRNPKLVTKSDQPQSDVKDFLRFLRKEEGVDLSTIHALDLGCGTGRNSNYLAEYGAKVIGYEISLTAIELAEQRAKEGGLHVEYRKQSMGEKFLIADLHIDLALDITSSNSLTEEERSVYLEELARVMKPGAWLMVKALCKDGDQNAKNLIKLHPGKEKDTYILPDVHITERVWSKEDFTSFYSVYFEITYLEKKTNYTQMGGRSYKRNFWIAYLKKK